MPVGFSEVQICNMALSNVGSKSAIESLDEDTPAANICDLWYSAARIATLEVYNWSFARRSATLALHSVAAPTNRFLFRYQWPSNCVMPRLIENPAGLIEDAIPFETEDAGDDTNSIITNVEDAILLYTYDMKTVSRFSIHFTLMLALRLGIMINFELTGKTAIADRLERRFETQRIIAPGTDASSGIPQPERDASWIRDRA